MLAAFAELLFKNQQYHCKKTNVCLMLMFLLWIIIGIRLFINMTFPRGYNLYLLSKESQFKTSGSFLLLFMKFEKKTSTVFFKFHDYQQNQHLVLKMRHLQRDLILLKKSLIFLEKISRLRLFKSLRLFDSLEYSFHRHNSQNSA